MINLGILFAFTIDWAKQKSTRLDLLSCYIMYRLPRHNQSLTHLEVIYLEDGLWVRQVIFLQVCIQSSSW